MICFFYFISIRIHSLLFTFRLMLYTINLEVFQGPFDLLLFLIQKDEIDIYNIPIIEITEQFVTFVERGDQINLRACR